MSGLLPRFGQTFENVKASASNPLRVGRFVEVVRRPRGGMNPGTWWRMTDGNGEFWLVPPANCRPVDTHFDSIEQDRRDFEGRMP